MIILKQEITEHNRNAISVDDFYYRGTEFEHSGGTGIRSLAMQYLRDRKIIDRRLILKNNGNTLEITTLFANRQYYLEFIQDDLQKEAMQFFAQRQWETKTETYESQDQLSILANAHRNIIDSFKNMSLEQIVERIKQLQGK